MKKTRVYIIVVLSFLIQPVLASETGSELTQQQLMNGWQPVDIAGTELDRASLQVGGSVGINARCNPQSIDATPDFSSENRQHICKPKSLHYRGTYGEILQVRRKTDSRGRPIYAVQMKVTDQGRSSRRDQTAKDQVSWVYYNPRRPHMQLYNDRLATVHPLGTYLEAAAKGQEFDLPWVTEPEVPPTQEPIVKNDNREILPETLVAGEEDIEYLKPGEKRQQPSLPGTSKVAPGPISEKDNRGEVPPATAGLCDYQPQPQTVDDQFCLNPPQRKKNGRWQDCNPPGLVNIDRHAKGALKPWVVDLVNQASQEVSEHSTTEVGNSCASPAMMMTLMDQESTFHPMSSNKWNDHGIAQFQLGTAEATAKYVQRYAAEGSPLKNAILKGLTWRPSGCARTTVPWAKNLSKQCFESIQRECVQDGRLVASLYCPQYAVRLQAFHIKQICAEPFYVNSQTGEKASARSGETINLTDVLLGEGDPATEARFIASRYNRGYRVFNSAVHYNNVHGSWPTAREYGKLWDVRRPAEYQRGGGRSDPSAGGNLYGHYINRCYNYKTVGLCGGMAGTNFDQYRKMTCAGQPTSLGVQGSFGKGVE